MDPLILCPAFFFSVQSCFCFTVLFLLLLFALSGICGFPLFCILHFMQSSFHISGLSIHRLQPNIFSRIRRRLYRIRSMQILSCHRDMLMPGQQKVIAELPCNLAGHVFSRLCQPLAGLKILLKTTVIDADAHIALAAQRLIFTLCRFKRIGNPQLSQILFLLPDVYIIRHDSGQTDAQSIFQHVNHMIFHAQFTAQVDQIRTQTGCVHRIYIFLQHLISKIEIVIPKCEIIAAHRIEPLGKRLKRIRSSAANIILGKWCALQRITTVKHQRISILFNLMRQIQKPRIFAALSRIIYRK